MNPRPPDLLWRANRPTNSGGKLGELARNSRALKHGGMGKEYSLLTTSLQSPISAFPTSDLRSPTSTPRPPIMLSFVEGGTNKNPPETSASGGFFCSSCKATLRRLQPRFQLGLFAGAAAGFSGAQLALNSRKAPVNHRNHNQRQEH